MSAFIENILQKLLTPDSDIIKHATKQLLEYFVSDKCVFGLFEVVKTSKNRQYKIYASTLLRKKVKSWKLLKQDERILLKSEIMDVLIKETEEPVRKQLIWLIGSIYKFSVKTGQEWPELFKFINDFIVSPDPDQHLFGVFVLSILNEEAAEQMKPHYIHLFKLFLTILTESNSLKASLYVINSLKNIIAFTNESELNVLSNLLPLAVGASIKIIQSDQNEETVTAVFDFFQSIIEYDIPMISPYIKNLTEMTLGFISDPTLQKPTRICAMNFLNVLIEIQKSNLKKNDMIRPIINSVFNIMCMSKDPLQTKSNVEIDLLDSDTDESGEVNVDESENIFTAATQVLDYCALYFPAKTLIKILIEYVSPAFTSENPLHRRAALAALAITSEGCADYYKNHYLEVLTDVCLKGMQDADSSVVQIAYFALCQFSEYLQPNLTHFSNRIINLLIESIETKVELRLVSRLTVRFYDALQSFCENLGEDLEKYLPTLMSKLMTLEIQCNSSLKLLRLIISTFSSIVSSVKTQFNPYFDFAVNLIKPHLAYQSSGSRDPESKSLQIECIDLMSVFAQYIGREKFNDSLIENCLLFVENTLTNENDPQLRSAAFDLLAGLTGKLRENLSLNTIMPHLVETLKSGEGINLIDSNEKGTDFLSAFDEIELNDEDDEEDLGEEDSENEEKENDGYEEDAQRLLVENEYVSEKLSAIFCLQEITKFMNPQLFDFYGVCFEELKNLSYLSHNAIKKESYLALAYLISYYHDFCIVNLHQKNETQKDKILLTFKRNLKEFHARSVKAIKHDANRDFIMGVFDAIRLLLSRCALFIRTNLNEYSSSLEVYGNLIIDTFKNKIFCQVINKENEATTEEEEEEQAEYDYVLKEYAGDIIPSLAACLPGLVFDVFFAKVLLDLFRLLHKSESSPAEKSFVIGVIGETVSNLDILPTSRAEQLFAEFYKYMFSNDDEIRSNAIFTIGVLCSQSKNALSQFYPQIIQDLYSILKKEKNKQSMDNVCGSLARLFVCANLANTQSIDYDLLVKAIFELTPLRTDFNEYHTLFTVILATVSSKLIISHYQKIIELSAQILANTHDEFKPGTKNMVVQFLKFVDQNYKEELTILLGQMKLEMANAIKTHL